MTTISNEMHEAIMSKMHQELESLRQENSRLRTALSSGLCSAHQEPDPLHCDICNGMKCFFNANKSLVEENSRLREALDKIYNHNEAARAAVIKYYGLHHRQIS